MRSSAKRCTKISVRLLASLAVVCASLGCQSPATSKDSLENGKALLAIADKPADVACLIVAAAGHTRTAIKKIDLASGGASNSVPLSGLPLGKVTFSAEGFSQSCAQVTSTSVPTWLSDPIDASVVAGNVATLTITLHRNGRASPTVAWTDEPACSAVGVPCLETAECCAGVCTSGVCGSVNLALNASGTGFPSPVESSSGWGGGTQKWDIVDGKVGYEDTWEHGLAFPGGNSNWAGQPCGWYQATVDFGESKTFNHVRVYHHRPGQDAPFTYKIEYWNGTAWLEAFSTTVGRTFLRPDLEYSGPGWGSMPTDNTFPSVTGSKVKLAENNCDGGMTHGWIHEFEVYND